MKKLLVFIIFVIGYVSGLYVGTSFDVSTSNQNKISYTSHSPNLEEKKEISGYANDKHHQQKSSDDTIIADGKKVGCSKIKNSDNLKPNLINAVLIGNITKNIYSQSPQKRIEAIAFISEYGSVEAKKIIKEIALSNTEKSKEVKSIAIITADWSSDFDTLTNFLKISGDEKDIKTAIIKAADLTSIDESMKEQFNYELLFQLNEEMDAGAIMNSLEYLKTKGNYFYSQSRFVVKNKPDLPLEVIDYLKL